MLRHSDVRTALSSLGVGLRFDSHQGSYTVAPFDSKHKVAPYITDDLEDALIKGSYMHKQFAIKNRGV